MKKLKVVIEPTNTGYSAFIQNIGDSVTTVGNTIDEVAENIYEALELLFDTERKKIEKEFKFEYLISIQTFFDIFKSINVSELARSAEVNESLLRQYAKGIKYPSIKQAKKIESAIHKLGENLKSIKI